MRYVRQSFAATLVIAAAMGAGEAQAQECVMWVTMENRNRHIVGDIETECTYGCPVPESTHTHLWGNWGVESNWGGAFDGAQFKGWKSGYLAMPPHRCEEDIDNRFPQWNSCTTDGLRPRGDGEWFNWPEGVHTEQWSPEVGEYAGGSISLGGRCPVDSDQDGYIDRHGCGVGYRTITFGNHYTELREIDPWSPDDHIDTFWYPEECCSAEVYCDGFGCGEGVSPWWSNNPHNLGSAQIRLRVLGAQWNDYQGCCLDGINYCSPVV